MRTFVLLLLVFIAYIFASNDEKHEAMEAVHPAAAGNSSEHNFIHDTLDTIKSSIHNGMEKVKGLFHHHGNGTEEQHAPNYTATH